MSWLGKILGGTIGFAMADFRDAPKIIRFYSSISEYPFSDAIRSPR